jgi:hypothetical protein
MRKLFPIVSIALVLGCATVRAVTPQIVQVAEDACVILQASVPSPAVQTVCATADELLPFVQQIVASLPDASAAAPSVVQLRVKLSDGSVSTIGLTQAQVDAIVPKIAAARAAHATSPRGTR